ncbi:MAG: TIGR02147 family protein [Fibrobacteraceae bacterium]|nr:TIGR02147 family protein [Fibrobacteraceae bacterium]
MNAIFEYTDYRTWMHDAFEDLKKRKSVISWRYMAMKIGADPGNLLRVSQGKIQLSTKLILSVAKFFDLSEKETLYWTELVYFGRAKTDKEALDHYEKMLAIKGVSFKKLETNELEFYRHWYSNAIRSLLGIGRFKDDDESYARLAESCTPGITVKEAKDSVNLLKNLKMISKDETGVWKVTDTFVSTGGNWRSEAVRKFQEDTISLAKDSLSRHRPPLRDISTVTMTFNRSDIALVRERIKELRSDLLRFSQEGSGDNAVFQLNVQLFPIALLSEEKEGNQ